MDSQETDLKFLPLPEVVRRTGLSRSTIYRILDNQEESDFPRPVKLTARRVAWVESEIGAWMQQRVEARA